MLSCANLLAEKFGLEEDRETVDADSAPSVLVCAEELERDTGGSTEEPPEASGLEGCGPLSRHTLSSFFPLGRSKETTYKTPNKNLLIFSISVVIHRV